FFSSSCDHRGLHSFPTRRSSDLGHEDRVARARGDAGGAVELAVAGPRRAPGEDEAAASVELLHAVAAVDDVDVAAGVGGRAVGKDRKSTRLNSSHQIISYAVFCL